MCFTPQFKYWLSHTLYGTRTWFYFLQLFLQLVSPNFWPFCVSKRKTHLIFTFTASKCGQHWHTYKSGCLRLFEVRKDWDAAIQHRATFNTPGGGNGSLISIFTQNDNERIVNLRSSLRFPQGMVSHHSLRVKLIFFFFRDSWFKNIIISEDSIGKLGKTPECS